MYVFDGLATVLRSLQDVTGKSKRVHLSAPFIPLNIKSDPISPSTNHGSRGWAIHQATKKSDGGDATAFQASKAELAKAPLRRTTSLADARYSDTSQTQLIPAVSIGAAFTYMILYCCRFFLNFWYHHFLLLKCITATSCIIFIGSKG